MEGMRVADVYADKILDGWNDGWIPETTYPNLIDYPTGLKGTERLVDICVKNGATTYISGISGSKYLDTKQFTDNDISLLFQNETKMVKKPIIDILKNKFLNV
jgi:hypothetical protein